MQLQLKDFKIANSERICVIAGPCAMESEKIIMQTAESLVHITDKLGIPYVFKASFDKANRTSVESFRGLGLEEGLRILRKVKETYGIPVLTDIHEPGQAMLVADSVDIIQIPAFLCRQTDLLEAAAKTNKIINIKKAQFLSGNDMVNVVRKMEYFENRNVMLCERGTTFGYNNLVVDMTGIYDMKQLGYPVIFDATHSVQKPGGNGGSTGGNRKYVESLTRAAVAVGVAGLFLETHPDPDAAMSDGPNMIALNNMEELLKRVIQIDEVVKEQGNE